MLARASQTAQLMLLRNPHIARVAVPVSRLEQGEDCVPHFSMRMRVLVAVDCLDLFFDLIRLSG